MHATPYESSWAFHTRREHSPLRSVWPRPISHVRLIDAELMRVVATLDLLVQKSLLRVPANFLQPRHSVNHVHRQAEAADVVVNRQLQWRVDAAFLFVPAHVDVFVVSPPISQPMNQLGVAVEIENDRLVHVLRSSSAPSGVAVIVDRVGLYGLRLWISAGMLASRMLIGPLLSAASETEY